MSTPRQSVIHDIGYRTFTGRRQSTGAIALSLYLTSLRHCFGLGRSNKSKVMPFLVAALMLIPALVLAGLAIQLKRMSLGDQANYFAPLSNYFGYPYWTQLLITVFAASQAPVLFARDLRYRTIVLYFARPLDRSTYVLVRLAALTTALFAVIAVPMVIWYAAALSSGLDRSQHTKNFFAAIVGVLVLSLILATFSGMVSAITTRSGLAVVAVIVALMLTSGIVTIAQGAVYETGNKSAAMIASMFNPFTLVAELISGLFDQPTPTPAIPHPSTGWTLVFIIVALIWVIGTSWVLVERIRKAASL
ncbi:hypothetical protein [Flexivirga meconopsidis]|uniref:hypothetical protein n=1 Tax=Flexivirga meconopsidis TaxID=2977121 RepID=UPI00223EFB49|nr:hypothetical protein [Flexivirga meconopsidis]